MRRAPPPQSRMVFGCMRSLQRSRVAFGLPRLQLEAGLDRLPGPITSPGWSARSRETPRGRPIQLVGLPAQPRANAEATPLSLSYGSLGWGDGRDLSGWPVQLRVFAVVHSESAVGPAASPAAGLRGGGQDCSGPSSILFKSFGRALASTSPGWPVRPWVCAVVHQATAARRVTSPTAGRRGGGSFASSHPPLSSYVSFGRATASTPPGRSVQLQGAVGHPGIVQLRPSTRRGSTRWRSLRVAGTTAGRGPTRWRPVIGRWGS
jgi:hypothetical protein